MRNYLILVMITICLNGCKKNGFEPSNENANDNLFSRNPFPTSISLGNDTTFFRVDSCTLSSASATLSTCGTAPDTEAPIMGTEVYQISGASQAIITGTSPRVHISNLTFGVYKFVGHAFILGYRSCDNQFMNDNAYDTIQITILKNRKKK